MRLTLMTLSAAALLCASPVQAGEAFTAEQTEAIKQIIKQYVTHDNPEVVRTAIQTLQQNDQRQQMQTQQDAFIKNAGKIHENPNIPVLGNPKGDVTIVEFFDYHCGYCKMAHTALQDLFAKDKNVRFVAIEFPILGDQSLYAARAALASARQGKYEKMHDLLMSNRGAMDEAAVQAMAKKAGLNIEKLKIDMFDKKTTDMIDSNRDLGRELGVRGTPMLIIGDELHPSAMNLDDMQAAVDRARKNGKK